MTPNRWLSTTDTNFHSHYMSVVGQLQLCWLLTSQSVDGEPVHTSLPNGRGRKQQGKVSYWPFKLPSGMIHDTSAKVSSKKLMIYFSRP